MCKPPDSVTESDSIEDHCVVHEASEGGDPEASCSQD